MFGYKMAVAHVNCYFLPYASSYLVDMLSDLWSTFELIALTVANLHSLFWHLVSYLQNYSSESFDNRDVIESHLSDFCCHLCHSRALRILSQFVNLQHWQHFIEAT